MARQSKTIHVLVDTREKTPFRFPEEVRITKRKLDAGDYSIYGWESYISIERKGWPDYYSCCMGSKQKHEAFRDQLTRLSELPIRCVIVEGIISRIFTGFTRGGRDDLDRIIYVTSNLTVEFGIPILFGEKRSIAQDLALQFLKAANTKVKTLWNHSSSLTRKSSNISGAKGKQSLRKLTKYNPKKGPPTS